MKQEQLSTTKNSVFPVVAEDCRALYGAIVLQAIRDAQDIVYLAKRDLDLFGIVDHVRFEDINKLNNEINNGNFQDLCDNASVNAEKVIEMIYNIQDNMHVFSKDRVSCVTTHIMNNCHRYLDDYIKFTPKKKFVLMSSTYNVESIYE